RILRFPVFSCQTHRPRTTREQANARPTSMILMPTQHDTDSPTNLDGRPPQSSRFPPCQGIRPETSS
ncbi:MAG: hypothetical protein WCO91_10350, partial [Gemmataceae bacterium]